MYIEIYIFVCLYCIQFEVVFFALLSFCELIKKKQQTLNYFNMYVISLSVIHHYNCYITCDKYVILLKFVKIEA